MIAGSAQAMLVNASLAQAATFLADRQAKGINCLWLEMLANNQLGGRTDDSTYDGITPFTTPSDLSTPRESYFARVDAMLNLCEQYGITALLTPLSFMMYAATMRANGVTKCYNYGVYLGNRYKDVQNVIWFNGEDLQSWSTQSDDDLVLAIANGIRAAAPNQLQTVQLDYPDSDSRQDSDWNGKIEINSAYCYRTPYARCLTAYNRTPAMPVFLGEAHYEHETLQGDTGTPNVLRRQEYWSMLSGACGTLNGNHNWSFWDSNWQSGLNDQGQVELTYLRTLLVNRKWYDLVPDAAHAVLTVGYGTYDATAVPSGNNYATCAYLTDGSLALVYMPDNRTMTIAMSQFSGTVTCRWYDPTNGSYATDAASPHTNTGTHDFSRASTNSAGAADWILVLEA